MEALPKWFILAARICRLAPVNPSPCFTVRYVAAPNKPSIPDENVLGWHHSRYSPFIYYTPKKLVFTTYV